MELKDFIFGNWIYSRQIFLIIGVLATYIVVSYWQKRQRLNPQKPLTPAEKVVKALQLKKVHKIVNVLAVVAFVIGYCLFLYFEMDSTLTPFKPLAIFFMALSGVVLIVFNYWAWFRRS